MIYRTLKLWLAGMITSKPVGMVIGQLLKNNICFRGHEIKTNSSLVDGHVKASLFWGLYEKQEAIFVERYLVRDLPVIELGSSIGVISCIIARVIKPQSLISYEANPQLLPIIQENFVHNSVKNATCLNYGVGEGPLFFRPGLNNTVGTVSKQWTETAVPIPCRTFSQIVKESGFSRYALVCDIEGSEVEFLFHDYSGLVFCETIIIELHQTTIADGRILTVAAIQQQIVQLGFVILATHGPVVVAKKPRTLTKVTNG